MRHLRISVAALVAVVTLAASSQAQGLTPGLFARYLDGLRQDLGIPGLSAAIVQDGNIVWDGGFGLQNVALAIPATTSTKEKKKKSAWPPTSLPMSMKAVSTGENLV